jgi:hypothetical protein
MFSRVQIGFAPKHAIAWNKPIISPDIAPPHPHIQQVDFATGKPGA